MCGKNVFRTLKSNEIECRVAQCGRNQKGVWASFLLYKDARVDQRIMDETFGAMNWQSEYLTIDGKMFCKVSVWDDEKKCWISKMNVGSESNTEPDKGLASDCLKRACFTWGLGVELYSSPKIFINLRDGEYSDKNGKIYPNLRLSVSEIGYSEDRKIARLALSDSRGEVRFAFGLKKAGFISKDGQRVLNVGDSTWVKAAQQAAAGKACADGTPIPIWLAETFNLPDEVMQKFVVEIEKHKNGNA